MVMPMCNNGSDMFERSDWNLKNFSNKCFNALGVRPRENWAVTEYGADRLQASSNIVFRYDYSIPYTVLYFSHNLRKFVSATAILTLGQEVGC